MSLFKFSSCLSCLSCFNFFSKCFKSNNSQSKDQEFLLGNNNELSQHVSDAQFLVKLTPAPSNNSPHQSPNNDSPRNVSPTQLYTLVKEVYTPENESQKHNYTPLPEVSPVSSDSFELSPSIMPKISPELTPAIAIEISQSPPIRSLSRENLKTKGVFFTRPPEQKKGNESQITSNSSDVEIIDSELSLNTTQLIDYANLSAELSQDTTQSMFDPISSTSISVNKMSTSQILGSINKDSSIQHNEKVVNTPSPKPLSPPSPNPRNNVSSINHQKKGELSIPPPQGYFPGTQKPLTNRLTLVPISKEEEVAMRIKTNKKGEVTCSF